MTTTLSHVDETGVARMVNMDQKPVSQRVSVARGEIRMKPETLALLEERVKKSGDVFALARAAALQAAKQTYIAVPLCHQLLLSSVEIDFSVHRPSTVQIEARVAATARTGVVLEALHAVSLAALTLYDLFKSVDRSMRISEIRLVKKEGGKFSDWT